MSVLTDQEAAEIAKGRYTW